MNEITKRQAITKLWEKSVLRWKLHKTQEEMYDFFSKKDDKIVTFLCSRRLGKSRLACVIAIETCLKIPNSVVKYLCPTQKMVQTTIQPMMREITEDSPKSCRPVLKVKDGVYVFPNGSQIQMAGTDGGNADRLRGSSSHLCIVDEAGFCDNLAYNVRSVLLPTTLTTKGRILLLSTPPKEAGHDFNEFVRSSDLKNCLIKKTIFENPMMSPADIQTTISSYPGGIKNLEFRREYLCEMNTDPDTAVIPEFSSEIEQEIVRPYPRPPFFDYYVSADLGFVDFTAILFAFYDFKNNKVVIEDEIVVKGKNTEELANLIKSKERELLYDPIEKETKQPYKRVTDVNWFIITDLQKIHSLNFMPTAKDDLDGAVNNVRVAISGKQIIIHPRCQTLIKHIKNANWKKTEKKREFARSADDGHYDALAALIYLLRNIDYNKSPYPKGYEYRAMENRFDYKFSKDADLVESFKKIFKLKKSL